MNVGIDITSLIYDRGVSRYTANLVQALIQRDAVNISLYGSSYRQINVLEDFTQQMRHVAARYRHPLRVQLQKYPPSLQELLWNTLYLNPVRRVLPQLDVFHSWDWIQPPDRDLPLVSTIHDLAMLHFPETAHPHILAMHRHAWQVLKDRQAEIIAVSQSTKRDIVQRLEIPASKVHVIYEALPQETVRAIETMNEEQYEDIKQQLQLDRPFVLFTGTREPRKNLARLIKAWEPLSREVALIVAGEEGWDEVKHPQVRFLGKVSNQELAVLYSEAEVFAYPSLYEGFGLPILEAFYFGTPVVTSNISSLPEVAGNAAELVDPHSVENIREGLIRVLQESREAQQLRLKRMIIRLHLFDWTRVAEETLRVYQHAVENV